MRYLLRPVAVLSAMLSASCDLAPVYRPPTVPVLPVSYKEGGVWQPATPSDSLKRGPWWQMYGHPMLDDLETQLVTANPDLAAAAAHYDTYRDMAMELNADLFPFVTSGASTSQDRQSEQRPLRTAVQRTKTYYGAHEVQANVFYEVDLWDKIHNRVNAGVANAQAAAADLASAQLSLEADLADAFLSLRELDRDIKLLSDTVGAYKRYLVIVQQRHAGEIASGLEVSQAAFQIYAAQAEESGILAQRAVYEHMIASLVGKPASGFTIEQKITDIPVPAVPTGLPSALLQRRPDIAAAERRVAAANATIGVARAAFYPSLDLNLTAGFNSSDTPMLLQAPFTFFSIGPSAFLPLFEGGLLNAQLAKSVALWREATENYRAVVLQGFQQVENGLSNMNLLTQQDIQQQAAVREALHTQSLAFDLYQGGAVNFLEVIVDQTAALAAEQAEVFIKVNQLHASVSLIRALGGGWSTDQLPGRDEVLTISATDPNGPASPPPGL